MALLLQNRSVVIIANLKPRNMRGIKSNGMVRPRDTAAASCRAGVG